jgi:hypothetical protein
MYDVEVRPTNLNLTDQSSTCHFLAVAVELSVSEPFRLSCLFLNCLGTFVIIQTVYQLVYYCIPTAF